MKGLRLNCIQSKFLNCMRKATFHSIIIIMFSSTDIDPRGAHTLFPVLSWYCKKENFTVKGDHKENGKNFKVSFMTQLRKKGQ